MNFKYFNDNYNLQHCTTAENLLKILESGFICPPKRVGVKSWSEDFLFFRIVPKEQFPACNTSIIVPFDIIERNKSFFIHPTSNIYGTVSQSGFRYSYSIKEEELDQYVDLFSSYDTDRDGLVSKSQLNDILDRLKLVKYDGEESLFDFQSFLYIYLQHRNCECFWEYISPELEVKLNIKKQSANHKCRIYDPSNIKRVLQLNTNFCDGGNEIGFDNLVYVKHFLYITIDQKEFNKLSKTKQSRFLELLELYNQRTKLQYIFV